jgi:threonine dehydrogenase-like Zn-dependent dehydrogenase
MKSLYFEGVGQLAWRDVPEPVIEQEGDAIIRITHATTCDIDPLIIRGRTPLSGPFALGHEAVGEISSISSSRTGLQPGDRVILTYYDACAHCSMCRRDTPNRCDTFSPSLPTRRWHGIGATQVGFFSELVRVPNAADMCTPVPRGADATHLASLGDNAGFAYEYTVPHLQRRPGADLLIMGGGGMPDAGGSIGLYAVAFACSSNAGRVDYVDTNRQRLDVAEKLGARVHDQHAPKVMGSYPITVDASADAAGLLCAIRSTEFEGICSSIGGHFVPVPLPLGEMYLRGIHFYIGPGRGRPNIQPVLNLIENGKFNPALITSSILPFEEAHRALLIPMIKPVFVVSDRR